MSFLPGEVDDVSSFGCEHDGTDLKADAEVLARHAGGSVAALRVALPNELVTCRPGRFVDPAAASPSAPAPASLAAARAPSSVDLIGLIAAGATAPGRPAWWDEVSVRLPPEVDRDDFGAQIDFVCAAYADQGRVREAIRLFEDIGEKARGHDERARLRIAYETARLYEVFLHDAGRALDGYLSCARFPLADAGEARQNRTAATFGALRALEIAGDPRGVSLYRVFARDLLLHRDPYGDLLLPEVFLRLGDLLRAGHDPDEARLAYRAAVAAGERLDERVPPNFRAPVSSARVALHTLAADDLDFQRVDDGTFEGEALGYNAAVGVRLTFHHGRMEELQVTDFGDKRPLDAYRILPRQVIEAQSLGVDGVTGATVTSRAVLNATAEAILTGLDGDGDAR